MNKIIKSALAAMSKHQLDLKNNYEQTRQLQHATRPYTKRISCNMMERLVHLDDHDILTRAFSETGQISPLMIFFHGGGFVTGDFDSYNNVAASIAQETGRKVISVNYRLAPEHKFPAGPEDCYAVTQQIIRHAEEWYQADPNDVILIGDSAGATLSCVVSMMARDRGGLIPKKQILIYPAAWCDFTDDTPFISVLENGADYILTQKQLIDYMELYASSPEDYKNPYFAPLRHTDFSSLPQTLVVTMEFDPLRDEGEELAKRMANDGTEVISVRIKNGIHGLISLPLSFPLTKQIYKYITDFTGMTSFDPNIIKNDYSDIN